MTFKPATWLPIAILSETQERLDFVERRLVQGSEARRVPPERG